MTYLDMTSSVIPLGSKFLRACSFSAHQTSTTSIMFLYLGFSPHHPCKIALSLLQLQSIIVLLVSSLVTRIPGGFTGCVLCLELVLSNSKTTKICRSRFLVSFK